MSGNQAMQRPSCKAASTPRLRLDDIAALKEAPLPTVTAPSNVMYLGLYPQATMGAIAIGIFIELIPLGGILLGLMILAPRAGRRAKD